jgi:palmitoyl-protein thioesterase
MFIPKLTVQALAAYNAIKKITTISDDMRPLVFWHGMGDSYNSSAMQRVLEVVHDYDPRIATFSVHINTDDELDQRASLLGDANVQVDYVCDQLHNITALDAGFDFIGFSQGGLFARAAVERCALNVTNLITFGSPHTGVSDLPKCSENDWLCKRKNAVLKRQVWRETIQKSVIAAQYFRDPLDYDRYLTYSRFLADVNNEREDFNQTYIDNFSKIEKLVLIKFSKDETLVPLDSAWFYDQNKTTGETLPFNQTNIYKNDLIGLKSLSDQDRIDFLSIDDRHMNISDEFLKDILNKYISKGYTP